MLWCGECFYAVNSRTKDWIVFIIIVFHFCRFNCEIMNKDSFSMETFKLHKFLNQVRANYILVKKESSQKWKLNYNDKSLALWKEHRISFSCCENLRWIYSWLVSKLLLFCKRVYWVFSLRHYFLSSLKMQTQFAPS